MSNSTFNVAYEYLSWFPNHSLHTLPFCRYSSRNLSAPIKANLHFSLSRSGVLTLDRADAVIEITEWVEVPKKNLTLENSTASSNLSAEVSASANSSAETGSGDSAEEGNGSLHSDGSASNPSNSSEKEEIAQATEKKLKKRTFRVTLKVNPCS